jgi:predicted MPP superfamily phosphohydrolase
VNEYRPDDGRRIAAKVTIFSIFIILFSYIGAVNLDHVFLKSVSAQESISINYKNMHSNSTQNNISLITDILAKNLEDRIQKAGAIFEITSKLPQVRNLPYAHLLNQTLNTLHGIPQYADIEKRQVVKNILSSNNDLYEIFFVMPNGNMYFLEPYSIQKTLSLNNYAFRDYFQGAIEANDTYLGNVHNTAAASGVRTAKIAVPVYSLKDNSTIAGVWAGSIDFNVLNKELQSLNLTSVGDSTRVVYVDGNGQKIADSDINKSKIPESFANLKGFKAATGGLAGSTIDTVNNTRMLVSYQPVNAFHNTWVVLSMLSSPP